MDHTAPPLRTATLEPKLPPLGEAGPQPPASPAAPGRPPVRLRALDGLRLLAAMMVCLYHYGGRDGEVSRAWGTSPRNVFPDWSQAFAYGSLGVQIFFVISGFVICMSGWGRGLRAFAVSRVSRLFPAYWAAVVLVTAVFALPVVVYDPVSPSDALVNLTMLQMPLGADRVLGVCWTLWVELRFYVLFAVFVVIPGATRRRVVLFCAAWTMAAVVGDAADEPLLDLVLMPEYAPFFVGGIGLYLLHRFGHDATAWGIVAVSWLLGQHYAVQELWHAPDPRFFSYRQSWVIVAVVTVGFAAVAAVALGRLSWMNWRWLTVAGALTYPFYLVHEHLGWAVIHALNHGLGLPHAVVLPVTVASMLLLAWLLYRLVEIPLTPRLKRALTPPRPSDAPVPPVPRR
ncbi:acyltransferase family protein [Streptomyces sp. HB2AG]|uniref:acyltransferase family protein n=1 Tax=Streptomyces sp. HB2AG TaxID=2983400 RepID=UPI0022AA785B|nr:acyltransferase [Streptomyces sp. HB2AG]MCZ2527408.1 acyltransferase [Streptomyces sp. HB2AG]